MKYKNISEYKTYSLGKTAKLCDVVGCKSRSQGNNSDGKMVCVSHGAIVNRCKYPKCESQAIGRQVDGKRYCYRHHPYTLHSEEHQKGISNGEEFIMKFFNGKDISYQYQKTMNGLKDTKDLVYDLFIKEYNLLIEYDGLQHFRAVKQYGGPKGFDKLRKHDILKCIYAFDNGYNFIRLSHKLTKEEITDTLNEMLNKIKKFPEEQFFKYNRKQDYYALIKQVQEKYDSL